jgi:hypothetical protein
MGETRGVSQNAAKSILARFMVGCRITGTADYRRGMHVNFLLHGDSLPNEWRLRNGQSLLNACIGFAQSKGFDRCYAETISEMTGAIAFNRCNGFRKLKAPIGQTNHGHND